MGSRIIREQKKQYRNRFSKRVEEPPKRSMVLNLKMRLCISIFKVLKGDKYLKIDVFYEIISEKLEFRYSLKPLFIKLHK